jgi:hypothetical protein
MILAEKTEEHRERTVPVPVRPSRIPHGISRALTCAFAVTNRLSYGMTVWYFLLQLRHKIMYTGTKKQFHFIIALF